MIPVNERFINGAKVCISITFSLNASINISASIREKSDPNEIIEI